ncbi:MAG: hypothetical protein H6985_18610 [Pseudomonadales bacterium]|nr:hypothetical protein [Pseudomonadales bacterium]
MRAGEAICERRASTDRRTFSWRTVVYGFLYSKRRALRRPEDAGSLFIDWHHPWLFFLALGIMILSCVDAFMTLQLIERGMVEVNPVMAKALGGGAATFAISKILMTGISILMLVYLARTYLLRVIRTGFLLTVFFNIYCCLVCYQFVSLLPMLTP